MNLRVALREGTAQSHRDLEGQYPFNSLTSSQGLDVAVRDFLICFKLLFFQFLSSKKEVNSFYETPYRVLSTIKPEMNSKLLKAPAVEDSLHLEYIFLGSRLGNQVILKQNPKLTEVHGGDFFRWDLPKGMWVQFCQDLECKRDPQRINKIVQRANLSFQELLNYGLLIEAQIGNRPHLASQLN